MISETSKHEDLKKWRDEVRRLRLALYEMGKENTAEYEELCYLSAALDSDIEADELTAKAEEARTKANQLYAVANALHCSTSLSTTTPNTNKR